MRSDVDYTSTHAGSNFGTRQKRGLADSKAFPSVKRSLSKEHSDHHSVKSDYKTDKQNAMPAAEYPWETRERSLAQRESLKISK